VIALHEIVMRSRTKAFGHPVHAILVAFPIGLWIVSFVFDLVYVWTRDIFWYRISFWDLIAGTAGACAAAIPGLIDFSHIPGSHPASKTAANHLMAALSVVTLYLVDTVLRINLKAASGRLLTVVVILSAANICLLGLVGWLGGELVFKHGVGVETGPGNGLTDHDG